MKVNPCKATKRLHITIDQNKGKLVSTLMCLYVEILMYVIVQFKCYKIWNVDSLNTCAINILKYTPKYMNSISVALSSSPLFICLFLFAYTCLFLDLFYYYYYFLHQLNVITFLKKWRTFTDNDDPIPFTVYLLHPFQRVIMFDRRMAISFSLSLSLSLLFASTVLITFSLTAQNDGKRLLEK